MHNLRSIVEDWHSQNIAKMHRYDHSLLDVAARRPELDAVPSMLRISPPAIESVDR